MKVILFCIFGFCIIACTSEKTLLKGNTVYTYNAAPVGGSATYTSYKVIARKKVKIVDNGNYLIIQGDPSGDASHFAAGPQTVYPANSITAWKTASLGNAYFSESTAGASQVLWYRDGKFVLQTASIPVKIRSIYKDPTNVDNYPSQVETGFNIGFLTGYKFTWNRFRSTNNFLGLPTDKYSITLGGLFSVGGTDLNTNTTRPKIVIPRKTAMVSYGTAIVFGFQSFNFGYAIGWDQGIGSSAESWIYKGKLWNGVILSLDLIK
jgi:hypothetical protein